MSAGLSQQAFETDPPPRRVRERLNKTHNPDLLSPTERLLHASSIGMMVGYVVEVSPAMARQWLEASFKNRTVRINHVINLARDIQEDRWRATHQGIAFSDTGRLIDGQHRLTAIIRANKPAFLTIFLGISDDMFGALDRGARRSIADDLLDEQKFVAPCTWLATRIRGGLALRTPAPAEVAEYLAFYRPILTQMLESAPSTARIRGAAGVKAAVMVRLKAAEANPKVKAMLLEQWSAFLRLQPDLMDKTTGALLRRIQALPLNLSPGTKLTTAAQATWTAFDPRSRSLERIVVQQELRGVQDMCDVALKQMERAGCYPKNLHMPDTA